MVDNKRVKLEGKKEFIVSRVDVNIDIEKERWMTKERERSDTKS